MLRIEASADAMGCTYSVALYDADRHRLETAVEEAFEEVRRLDQLLSNYKAYSEWTEVNRWAAERPVTLPREMFDLIAQCQHYSAASEGAFDITVGPLMRVWGFYKGTGRLPAKPEVDAALKNVGYRNVLLDASTNSVRFARHGVEIDPGGIGKGYAVDRMVEVLRRNQIRSGLVTAAGSSIYGLGTPPGEPGWRVDIRDPRNPVNAVQEVVLHDQSMSTSGTAEKFFVAHGQHYSHIMDPRTGFPAVGMLSVSVIADRAIDSEAWTKPIFINGRQWALQHQPAGIRAFLCEDKPQPSCAWLQ